MLDLDQILDPWSYASRPAGPPAGPARSVPLTPYSPEEEEGVLKRVANAGLGGIAYLGSALEKPGRAVRGILAGKPREALAAIPFSDALGITDYADRTSGRDLLRRYGMADKEDTWGNFLGGLAAEIATDPLTFLTPLAATKAGQVAAKAGVQSGSMYKQVGTTLREALDAIPDAARQAQAWTDVQHAAGGLAQTKSLLDQPLRSVASFKIPFVGEATPLGAGAGGQKFLDAVAAPFRAGYKAHEFLGGVPYAGKAYSALAGWPVDLAVSAADVVPRYAKALLSRPHMNALTAQAQAVTPQRFYQGLSDAADWEAQVLGWSRRLKEAGFDSARDLRGALEGTLSPVNPQARAVVDEILGKVSQVPGAYERLGIPIAEHVDPLAPGIRYGAARHTLPIREAASAEGASPFRTLSREVQTPRKDYLLGFSGGSNAVEDAMNDLAVYTLPRDQAAAHVVANYLEPLNPANFAATPSASAAQAFQAAQAEQMDRALRFVEAARARTDRAAMVKSGQRVPFWEHPLQSIRDYGSQVSAMKAAGEAGLDLLASPTVMATGRRMVSVPDALRAAGLTAKDQAGDLTALAELGRRMGGLSARDVAQLAVPAELAAELTRVTQSYKGPQAAGNLLGGIDYLTDLFKRLVTSPFPGFQARNLAGGQFSNAVAGGAGALGEFQNANRLLAGQAVKGANLVPGLQHLSEAEATARLADVMHAWNILGAKQGQHADSLAQAAAQAPTALQDMLGQVPGATPKTLGGLASDVKAALTGQGSSTWNPKTLLSREGIENFAPVAAGQAVGGRVEALNRIPLFLALKKQGYSDAQAALETLRAHGDYTGRMLTSTEKSVMRRLVPFYTYTRFNTPFQLSALAANPGTGLGSLYAKAAQDLRTDEFLPPYLGTGLALPLGAEDPQTGMRRYLTRIDTPIEQVGDLIKPGGLTEKGMGLLSQLNPLLKAPLELMTGKQFFTGRELEDLQPITGSQFLDQALMNSPLSRLITTGRTLADTRKWDPYAIPLNLLTGAKVSDVDVPKYRSIAEREYVEDVLRGLPNVGHFESLSIRPEALATMTPDQIEMVRLQRTLESRARKQAAEKKKVRMQGG
jgi:hypothetical protein